MLHLATGSYLHPHSNQLSPKAITDRNLSCVDYNRVSFLMQELIPLTLPFRDLKGHIIQLWKIEKSLLGSVMDDAGHLVIIPGKKIVNSLNPHETPYKLITRLMSCSLRKWDIVYDIHILTLFLWPHLEAAGKYSNMPAQEVIKDAKERLERLTTGKGALNREHYVAFRKESKGIPLLNREGKPLLNPKDNQPYDHRRDVHGYQRGAKNLILDIKERLRSHDLTPSDRKELENFIAKTDVILKNSVKFTKTVVPPNKYFVQTLHQTGLVKSFKVNHPHIHIPERKGSGEIGGVACSLDYFEGLFDSPEALFEKDHFFCLPTLPDGTIPFSNHELRQILRELAVGVYVHSTIPFFSLHFNQNGNLFPVIHPAYEKTLVGRVIGMLDYIMKGYLNGGVFDEPFIQNWYKNSNWDSESNSALQQLIDFEEYCQAHLKGKDSEYVSLRTDFQKIDQEEMFNQIPGLGNVMKNNPSIKAQMKQMINQFTGEPEILKDFTEFSNSFRIIAKQKSLQKEGNLFMIDADFDVFYTINPSPRYKEAQDEYIRQSGQASLAYQGLEEIYTLFTKRIHDHLVKFPLCQKYFSMLSVINFFSGYFSTLKKHRKQPVLPLLQGIGAEGCPSLFPHLPIKKKKKWFYKLTSMRFLEVFLLTNRFLGGDAVF